MLTSPWLLVIFRPKDVTTVKQQSALFFFFCRAKVEAPLKSSCLDVESLWKMWALVKAAQHGHPKFKNCGGQ